MSVKAVRDFQVIATNNKTGEKIAVRNGHKFSEKEAKEYRDMCEQLSKGNMKYEIERVCQPLYTI